MNPKIQIQIVTWNSQEHLNRLFLGIERQKGVDFNVLVIDNASKDGTVEWLKNHNDAVRHAMDFVFIQNTENKGFACAHNQGFEMCAGPYVLVLNPDTELQDGFLREAVNMIESDEKIASVGGVLYQILPKNGENGVIDSLGLQMRINGQVVEIGQNTAQNANFGLKTGIFGISGACVLYRLPALKQVKDEYGIFDERFGSFKEDVDLAWRLKNAGFKAVITSKAVCWHERGVKSGNRAQRSERVKYLSIRNHLLMLKKNLSWRDWYRMPFIIAYELVKFIYVILFERQNLKAYMKAVSHKP